MLLVPSEGEPLEAISMAALGPFRRDPRGLTNPPNMPTSWWHLDFPFTLGARFRCPVFEENDANTGAQAEARFGAGRGYRSLVYYTVSTAMGAGVAKKGRLRIGRHDTEPGVVAASAEPRRAAGHINEATALRTLFAKIHEDAVPDC